ncbi:MAG TPA: hypothetical protein VM581_03820 [Magnetospirillaceae bacterium]|nr:hypothetical protein [Magnetospirillaceae bacterium]
MGPTLWWSGRKLMRNYAGYFGTLLIIAGIVVLMAFSPALISAASANSRTTDPIPTHRLAPWTGNPQAFANAARISLDEVWRILASYSHGRASQTNFPRITVAKEVTRADCALSNPSQTYFDPIHDFVDFCKNGSVLYVSHSLAMTFEAQFGHHMLLALVVEQLTAIKAEQRSNIEGFAACVTGAWLGYLHNNLWHMIERQVVNEVQAYFTNDRGVWFLKGYNKRSLDPCLEI